MKVVIEYDASSGEMKDAAGTSVGFWSGLQTFEEFGSPLKPDEVVELAKAGLKRDDIVALRQKHII